MARPTKCLNNTLGGLLTGFISGGISGFGLFALSLYWPLLAHHDTFVFFAPGTIFGTAISVYFFLFASHRSLLKALSFIAICTGTEIAMFLFAAFVAMSPLDRWVIFLNSKFVAMIAGIFLAGAIGTFLVLISASFLFSIARGIRQVAWIALSWSLLGGVLAVFGFTFGFFVTPALAGFSAFNMFSFTFFTWQSGMGLVLGFISQRKITSEFGP